MKTSKTLRTAIPGSRQFAAAVPVGFTPPNLSPSEVVYGRPLHASLAETLRTGVSDATLASSTFDSFDDSSDIDYSAQYGKDRLERLELAIASGSRRAVAQAAAPSAPLTVPAASPAPSPVSSPSSEPTPKDPPIGA